MFVGGLFRVFSRGSDSEYAVDQSGVRRMAAVQMAIDRVNNKHDGIYDTLLPRTKVRCRQIAVTRYLTHC